MSTASTNVFWIGATLTIVAAGLYWELATPTDPSAPISAERILSHLSLIHI